MESKRSRQPKNPEMARATAARYAARYRAARPEIRERNRVYCEKYNARTRFLRHEAIRKVGGVCGLCGHDEVEALTIDHINGDGAYLRKQFSQRGRALYEGIVQGRISCEGLRVLCLNCHIPQGWRGWTPIEAMRRLYCGIEVET